MGLRESFQSAIRTVSSVGKRMISGEQRRTPTPAPSTERSLPTPPTPLRVVEQAAPAVKGHRQLAKERQDAEKTKERRKSQLDKVSHEELYTEADQILQDLEQIAPHLTQQARNYLDGYRNEFDALVKTQFENAQHDLELLNKNELRMKELKNHTTQTAGDLERLQKSFANPEAKKDTDDILALGKRYGMPIPIESGAVLEGAEKMAMLEQLHQHIRANNQSSLKLNLLLVKARTQLTENKVLGSSMQTMRQRQSGAEQEIARLTEQNGHIKERLLFIKKSLADFRDEVNRFRNNVAERTSLPPDPIMENTK